MSPDGKFLVYQVMTGDQWAVPLTGDKKPFPDGPGGAATATFSAANAAGSEITVDLHWMSVMKRSGRPKSRDPDARTQRYD